MRIVMVLAVTAAALVTAMPAYADPPEVSFFHDEFVDLNPCTGLNHTVTIDVTSYEPVFGTRHATHTVTTSSGFSGGGVEIGVFHDAFFIVNDILLNPATRQRIHAHLILLDGHVEQASLTCIPADKT